MASTRTKAPGRDRARVGRAPDHGPTHRRASDGRQGPQASRLARSVLVRRLDQLFADADVELARSRRGARHAARALGIDDLEGALELDSPVLVRPTSENRKLSPVDLVDVGGDRPRPAARAPYCSSTYVPIAQTCPSSCPFKGHGCMAESGYSGRPVRRLEANARGLSSREISRHEAAAIDRLFVGGVPRDGGRDGRGARDLRLHVSGDVTTVGGLRDLVAAVERWKSRGGGSCWTFTHAWRSLDGASWGPIAVLASIEEPAHAELARARGYAPAITVRSFPSSRAFDAGGTTWIPCPAETSDRTCVECRLCLDHVDRLRESGRGIAFAVHGPGVEAARRRLPVIGAVT